MSVRKLSIIFMLLSVLLLIACGPIRPTPIVFKLEGKMPKEFPAKVTYNYYISTDTKNLYGDDVYITFKFKGDYFKIYPVKKTDKGYIVMDSKAKDYIVPDITKWGFYEPVQLNEQNGQISIEMQNSSQANKLISSPGGMSSVCGYYNCYEDE